jgi:hypothetical protein
VGNGDAVTHDVDFSCIPPLQGRETAEGGRWGV